MSAVLLKRSQVLEVLRQIKPSLYEKYGVTHLGIFGSVARDQATASSDIDIVMQIERPSFLHLSALKKI